MEVVPTSKIKKFESQSLNSGGEEQVLSHSFPNPSDK